MGAQTDEKNDEKSSEKEREMDVLHRTMVVSYNPLQSVIVTADTAQDITHPIHLYSRAYAADFSGFYHSFDLDALYNGWMQKPVLPKTVGLLYDREKKVRPS